MNNEREKIRKTGTKKKKGRKEIIKKEARWNILVF